jgi:hypothetical protein
MMNAAPTVARNIHGFVPYFASSHLPTNTAMIIGPAIHPESLANRTIPGSHHGISFLSVFIFLLSKIRQMNCSISSLFPMALKMSRVKNSKKLTFNFGLFKGFYNLKLTESIDCHSCESRNLANFLDFDFKLNPKQISCIHSGSIFQSRNGYLFDFRNFLRHVFHIGRFVPFSSKW